MTLLGVFRFISFQLQVRHKNELIKFVWKISNHVSLMRLPFKVLLKTCSEQNRPKTYNFSNHDWVWIGSSRYRWRDFFCFQMKNIEYVLLRPKWGGTAKNSFFTPLKFQSFSRRTEKVYIFSKSGKIPLEMIVVTPPPSLTKVRAWVLKYMFFIEFCLFLQYSGD